MSERTDRSPIAREALTMRALYLFINGLASSNAERRRDHDLPWDDGAEAGLTPIRPGAFARWMTARDASTSQGGAYGAVTGARAPGARAALSPRSAKTFL